MGWRRPWGTRQTTVRLAAILLLIVAMTNYLYAPLSTGYADPEQAGRNLYYVIRGMGGVALFMLICLRDKRPLVWAVGVWGATEEAQVAVCGMAVGIDNTPAVPLFEGLCGKGYYTLGLVAVAILAAKILDKGTKR